MAAKTPREKSKPAKDTSPPEPRRSLLSRGFRKLWRPLPLLLVAVSLAGVMFWPEIVAHIPLPDLSESDEYQITWSEIVVTPPGHWVPQEFVSQVGQRSGLEESFSLLDHSLVNQLAEDFARHPWVAEVQSVKKQIGKVRVDLVYRQPALMVQTRRGIYPVDAEGVLLPPRDFSAADTKLFPRLEGVRTTPQGPAGTSWGDPAVSGGSRLATVLSGSDGKSAWNRFGLESIVVLPQENGPVPGETNLFGLTTKSGSRIVWGHAPGTDTLEPTIEQKLQRLEEFLADNGPFEEMPEPVWIDVHDWEVIRWNVLSRSREDTIQR